MSVCVLGAPERLLGALGQDSVGDFMLDFLVGPRADVRSVRREADASTGQAFIAADYAARNMMVVAAAVASCGRGSRCALRPPRYRR